MRSRRRLRESRPVHVAAGALMLSVPTTAVALAAGQADAQSAIQIDVSDGQVGFGQHVTVTGTAPPASAGQRVSLEFAGGGGSSWQTLTSTQVGSQDRFRFRVALRKSGLLRAVISGASSTPRATVASVAGAAPNSVAPSSPRPISVASKFQLARREIDVLGGQVARVHGRLLPGVAGRRVRLEGRKGRGWRVLGSARTGRRGGFDVRYRPGSGGARGEQLRVVFRGDRLNAHSASRAGRVTVFRESLASWYNDGGSTACGFHAGLGVANKVLPCGTKVIFRYGGRTLTATVDDRGPYVSGREWDLNQNTANALGFGGVGAIWSTA
jgi:rare lipoprotein A